MSQNSHYSAFSAEIPCLMRTAHPSGDAALQQCAVARSLIDAVHSGRIDPSVDRKRGNVALKKSDFFKPMLLNESAYDVPLLASTWSVDGLTSRFAEVQCVEQSSGEKRFVRIAELRDAAVAADKQRSEAAKQRNGSRGKSRATMKREAASGGGGAGSSTPPPTTPFLAEQMPLMHNLSCVEANRHVPCMGCSTYWRHTAMLMQRSLRPWDENDMLRYDPVHGETMHCVLASHGSFVPLRHNMLSTDAVYTLCRVDGVEGAPADTATDASTAAATTTTTTTTSTAATTGKNATAAASASSTVPDSYVLWAFVAPHDVFKVRALVGGARMHEHGALVGVDELAAAGIDVSWAVQTVGDTVVTPAGWMSMRVFVGRGLFVGAQWNILRLACLVSARKVQESHRLLAVPQPVNVTALAVSAAYQQLDELDALAEARNSKTNRIKKRRICEILQHLLPLLQLEILEEFTGDALLPSGFVALAYDYALDRLKEGVHVHTVARMKLLNDGVGLPNQMRWSVQEVFDEARCDACKIVLYNVRRCCDTCRIAFCQACFNEARHQHPMVLRRKMHPQTLLDLAHNIEVALGRPPEHRRKRSASQRDEASATTENADDEDRIDCICGVNQDRGFMLFCEICHAWLHGTCVGVKRNDVPEHFYCPRCV